VIEQGVINLLLGAPVASGSGPTGILRSTAQAAFVAAVGEQVYPGKAPQSYGYPYAVVVKIGADHKKQMGGRAGLAGTKVRVEVYHQLYGTAELLADYARQLLDGYRGALANGMSCQGIFQVDDSNQWERPVHSDEQGVQTVEIHLKVWANET